ncbi:MAG: hypothetical protein E5X80_26415 [Mesorhizobium sp.]|uniref:hypothetical protein n=1 Tax=Mesorhizobium sp. TaxID=1871066 RepID=UPI000FE832F5|nr:hypothetical protein [Mesorhizobium sp.]RWM05338.1 MAG: hypothetical protein EOR71_24830 [Mesorhizobium sp.]TIO51831.1 MAG: hypothetical protein E5X78_14820 [Mesorhizobium sp.]TIO58056.1 MAG: hypothetical protein E5X79_23055 [Mesorhizobium sp.]TJV59056.1 MAG: hypothetical protein E5X80_26415 [Mesorhizobium sp.]
MRIDQASSSRWAGIKWEGRAGAAIAVLLLLAGCSSFRMSGKDTYQTSGIAAYQANGIDQWLTTADADAVVNAMAAKGMIPETIDCRFVDTTPGEVAYVSKFTWKRAPANTRYNWEIGDPTNLASKKVKTNRVGLRRVFAKVVRDPASGQKVGCSVWVG